MAGKGKKTGKTKATTGAGTQAAASTGGRFVYAACPWDDCRNPRVAIPSDAAVGDLVTCPKCKRPLRVADMGPPPVLSTS